MPAWKVVIIWTLRLLAVFIMVQSLFFKFSAAEESIYIFSTLGMEPWGRIGTGIVELIASVLLLIPRTTWIGAGLGMGTMMGAIFFHLTILGIEVGGDRGQLFLYAVIAWLCCLVLLIIDKQKIQTIVQSAFSK
jgi:uncharacterized membrane protein YphA (DoxX/SURF4 family)